MVTVLSPLVSDGGTNNANNNNNKNNDINRSM